MVEKINIKDKLNQLKDIEKGIYELDYKIKKLEKEGYKLAPVQESRRRPPFGKHDIIIEAQSLETRDKINRYKYSLQTRMNNLLTMQIEISEFINTLPSVRLQRIFEYKYMNHYSYRKIAYIVGGTEESIRKEHDRFLQDYMRLC